MADHKQKLIVKLIVFMLILGLAWYIGYLTGKQSSFSSINQNSGKLMDNGGNKQTGQLPPPPPIVGNNSGESLDKNGLPLPPPVVE